MNGFDTALGTRSALDRLGMVQPAFLPQAVMTDSGHRCPRCIAPGCNRRPKVAGCCTKHYQQVRRHGRLTPEREYGRLGSHCRAEDCQETPVAKGYCMRHYQQMRRSGHIQIGNNRQTR